MQTNSNRVMLFIDFIGTNFPSALYALQQWSSYAKEKESEQYECVIGVSTWSSRSKALPGSPNTTARDALRLVKEFCQGLPVVYWDTDVQDHVDKLLKRKGFRSQPSFSSFSYGCIVNRGLLLAREMKCSYLVRIDPGTCPKPETPRTSPSSAAKTYSFKELLDGHISTITTRSGAVVSRTYKGRLSVRDDFLAPNKHDIQCDLVKDFTGIDPRHQVTGGALFTSAVPGIPTIPFESSIKGPTFVWGSDDGRYQLLQQTDRSLNVNDDPSETILIPRFDSVGKPKPTTEYYRGLAGAVYLHSLENTHDPIIAGQQVEQFITQLKNNALDPEKCRIHDQLASCAEWEQIFIPGSVAPKEFLQKIAEGYNKYGTLIMEWEGIGAALTDNLLPMIQVL